jgi:uncharacterized protein
MTTKNAMIGLGQLEIHLSGVRSLKEKRSVIRPLINRLTKKLNVACSEIDQHDVWQSATIAFVSVSNSSAHSEKVIRAAIKLVEDEFPDAMITREHIEIL